MYIARQPIFDKTKDIYGYELLFRDSNTSVADKKAFVNFNYNSLLSNSIELVDPSTLVIEVLEDVQVDNRLMRRLESLRKEGYRIALDDFDHSVHDFQMVSVADIIKFDLLATPLHTIQNEIMEALRRKKVLLAEKVETEKDFIEARKMGFHLFQGYFFSKPIIVAGLKGKKPDISIYRRILNELHSEDPSFQILSEILESDVSVAYRLVNVVSRKNDNDIQKGLKSALIKMGLTDFERWVHIMMLQDLSVNKPSELIRTSLIRSKFGELIAYNCGLLYHRYSEISLMCLFSVLDAMLDLTMEEAMEDLSISDDIKDALVKREGPLEPVLKLAESYEKGDWEEIDGLSKQIGIDGDRLVNWYMDSINWAERIMTGN